MLFRFLFSLFFLLNYLGFAKIDSAQAERPQEQELQEDSQPEPQSQFSEDEIEVPVPPGIVPEENRLGAIKVTKINGTPILIQRIKKDDFSPEAFRAFNLDAIEKKLKSYVFNPIKLNFEEDKKIASVLDQLGVYSENPLSVWNLEIAGRGKSGATHLYEGEVLREVPEYTQDRLPLIQLLKLQELPGVVKVKRILKSDNRKLFIAMEKLSSIDLSIDNVSENKLTEIVDSFTRSVIDLNEQGFYHYDMHCSNIMFRGHDLVIIDYDSFGEGQHENLEFAHCILRSRFEGYYRNKIKKFVDPISKLLVPPPKTYMESFYSMLPGQKPPCVETNPSLSFFTSVMILPYLPTFESYRCEGCSKQMSGCFTNWPWQRTSAGVEWLPVIPMVFYWYQRVFDQFEKVLDYSEEEFKANWKALDLESRKAPIAGFNTIDNIHIWVESTFDLQIPNANNQRRLIYAVYLAREALGSEPTRTLETEVFDEIRKFGPTEAALVKVVQGKMTLSELASALSGLLTD